MGSYVMLTYQQLGSLDSDSTSTCKASFDVVSMQLCMGISSRSVTHAAPDHCNTGVMRRSLSVFV